MGFFSLKATCAICGKEVGWSRYKIHKSQEWCCSVCYKKASRFGVVNFFKITTEELRELVEKKEKFSNTEVRMKCNVCGKVYCFTGSDLEQNEKLAKEARSASLLSFFVPLVMAGSKEQEANAKMDKIVDYSRCPCCNSTKVVALTEEEFKAEQQNNNSTPTAVSSVDELKNFKELLDSGIITQDEFEAKKKQLLGL